MNDSPFPLYPFERDPLGILSGRLNPKLQAAAPPADAEPPEPAEEAADNGRHEVAPDDPSRDGEDPEPAAVEPPSPPETLEDAAGKDPVPQIVADWVKRHWDAVKAMACAEETPQRPSPPPPPAPPAEPRPMPPIHVARGDRWTKKKMTDFLRMLAATQSVSAAARSVGMSRQSAHKLRNRLKGQPFDVAWEAAFRHGYDNLAHAALELALEGEEVPHYHQGELKGTHRKRHPNLMVQLLRMRNRVGAPMLGRYGAAAEYHSEHWDALLDRVENGSVDWSDEHAALGEDGVKRLDLPDEERQLKLIELRNLPDEGPPKRGGR